MTDGGSGYIGSKYGRYVEEIKDDISETMQKFGCQPILFVGSGLTKRYVGTPNWDELLSYLAELCPNIEKGIGFYKQSFKTPMRIGEEFSRLFQNWAWGNGHAHFPKEMFDASVDAQSYIKYKIATYIREFTEKNDGIFFDEYSDEIGSLKKIRPHAVITTNYDCMMEILFPDHTPIIGQQILKGQQISIGEIYKIHGCVSEYNSIVFTQRDYDNFMRKKKFLSAKLLTFFNEHPLIFIGYSAGDPNIRAILSDIDEALPEKGGVVPNVYILEWNRNISSKSTPAREKIIPTEDERSVRVKLIEASDFGWVFDAFSSNPVLNDINPRVLRALVARSYDLVRHDIPNMKVHADFQMLTESVESSSSFAKLFGIANISDYSIASAQHPLSATQLGKMLGFKGWHHANKLMDKIISEKGINIKECDNKYHRSEMVNKTKFHKFSHDAVDLLRKVKNGEDYNVDI
ncbi:SIR2 family NAD-dependent protein deacylase [Azospirillum cavernae]|nr:SIR2 family protein [Azospirillum cavernae]